MGGVAGTEWRWWWGCCQGGACARRRAEQQYSGRDSDSSRQACRRIRHHVFAWSLRGFDSDEVKMKTEAVAAEKGMCGGPICTGERSTCMQTRLKRPDLERTYVPFPPPAETLHFPLVSFFGSSFCTVDSIVIAQKPSSSLYFDRPHHKTLATYQSRLQVSSPPSTYTVLLTRARCYACAAGSPRSCCEAPPAPVLHGG